MTGYPDLVDTPEETKDEHGRTADPVVRLTSPMLTAMTHPVRRRIIALMAPDLPMRAVDLAQRLEVPANAVSFHLRKLAEAGMIVEAPEHARDGRDRVWVSAGRGFGIPTPEQPLRPEDEAALRAYTEQAHLDIADLLRRVATWSTEWSTGRDPVPRADLSVGTLDLTREDMLDVMAELNGVLERARQRSRATADQPDRLTWDVLVMAAEADLGRRPPGPAGPRTTGA